MKLVVASLFAVALAVPAWGQEKDGAPKQEEKKAPAKDGGEPVKKPVKEPGEGPTLSVEEVDTNGDGRISAAELKAAVGKLGGYYPKKEGVKDGDAPVKKVAPKDAPKGDGTKEPSKDGGDGAKKAPAPAPKDGQK